MSDNCAPDAPKPKGKVVIRYIYQAPEYGAPYDITLEWHFGCYPVHRKVFKGSGATGRAEDFVAELKGEAPRKKRKKSSADEKAARGARTKVHKERKQRQSAKKAARTGAKHDPSNTPKQV